MDFKLGRDDNYVQSGYMDDNEGFDTYSNVTEMAVPLEHRLVSDTRGYDRNVKDETPPFPATAINFYDQDFSFLNGGITHFTFMTSTSIEENKKNTLTVNHRGKIENENINKIIESFNQEQDIVIILYEKQYTAKILDIYINDSIYHSNDEQTITFKLNPE